MFQSAPSNHLHQCIVRGIYRWGYYKYPTATLAPPPASLLTHTNLIFAEIGLAQRNRFETDATSQPLRQSQDLSAEKGCSATAGVLGQRTEFNTKL